MNKFTFGALLFLGLFCSVTGWWQGGAPGPARILMGFGIIVLTIIAEAVTVAICKAIRETAKQNKEEEK